MCRTLFSLSFNLSCTTMYERSQSASYCFQRCFDAATQQLSMPDEADAPQHVSRSVQASICACERGDSMREPVAAERALRPHDEAHCC